MGKQKIVQVLWACNRETRLNKLSTAKCPCFVLLAADFMEALVQMACVQYAIKNILQRQNNSNGKVGPPGSVSSLSESSPAQRAGCSIPVALSPLDSISASALPSPVSNQSLLSESVSCAQVYSSSVDKAIPEMEDCISIRYSTAAI